MQRGVAIRDMNIPVSALDPKLTSCPHEFTKRLNLLLFPLQHKAMKKLPALAKCIDFLRMTLGRLFCEMNQIIENGERGTQAKEMRELTDDFFRHHGMLAGMVYAAQQTCDAKTFARLMEETDIDESELAELISLATDESIGLGGSAFSA